MPARECPTHPRLRCQVLPQQHPACLACCCQSRHRATGWWLCWAGQAQQQQLPCWLSAAASAHACRLAAAGGQHASLAACLPCCLRHLPPRRCCAPAVLLLRRCRRATEAAAEALATSQEVGPTLRTMLVCRGPRQAQTCMRCRCRQEHCMRTIMPGKLSTCLFFTSITGSAAAESNARMRVC